MPISDAAGNAYNHTWSNDDFLMAYQSDVDGDMDIYVYEFATGLTRKVTENDIADYAPTWICETKDLVFTSDITGDPNIFDTPALPLDAPPVDVLGTTQRTSSPSIDRYPQNSPSEETASRQDGEQ